MIPLEPPVTPDADTARRWAEEELAGSEYAESGGNWLMDAIDWLLGQFTSLTEGVASRIGDIGLVIAALVAVAVTSLIVWLVVGPLRRARRAPEAGDLFEDARPATALAAGAARAAQEGDWATATAELYRALIRLLSEREIIVLTPGVTAHEAAVEAGAALPMLAGPAMVDADAFDRIRYGDGFASPEDYAHVQETYRLARGARRTVGGAPVDGDDAAVGSVRS